MLDEKLVTLTALEQLATRIKNEFYDKDQINEKLSSYIKTITLGGTTYTPTNQNITLPSGQGGGAVWVVV